MVRYRRSAGGSLPPRHGLMPALYQGTCECGREIRLGDCISADKTTGEVLCVHCYRKDAALKASLLSGVKRPKQWQDIVDRIRQLRDLSPRRAETEQELESLKRRLMSDFIADKEVQRYLFSNASCPKCRPPLIPIPTKYENDCCRCGTRQREGRIVLWSRRSKTIHCVECMSRR